EDPQNFGRGHARRFGKLADRARQLNRDLFFTRRSRTGARAHVATWAAPQHALRAIFCIDRRDVASPCELELFASAQDRAALFFAVGLSVLAAAMLTTPFTIG